jgi:hypothetical protein
MNPHGDTAFRAPEPTRGVLHIVRNRRVTVARIRPADLSRITLAEDGTNLEIEGQN